MKETKTRVNIVVGSKTTSTFNFNEYINIMSTKINGARINT